MGYYAPFTLDDAEGNEYQFLTELDTSEAPRFNLVVEIKRNGKPWGRRVWRGMVPMLGILRSFAVKYVESPAMQRRFREGQGKEEEDV
ncbi:MAG: hypothetical protein HY685_02180 [Chloroflexi bacterium]|nr:hypothetical protein [Chloroflexota bacterium]